MVEVPQGHVQIMLSDSLKADCVSEG